MKTDEVSLPSKQRLDSGPAAIIECPQKIPCDPCQANCPPGAIELEGINDTPEVDFDKCTGCSVCVESCPGLAIFTIDCSPDEGCRLTLPYEFNLPEVGEKVTGLDRKGEEIAQVTIKNKKSKDESKYDTPTVTVQVSEEHINELRNIRRSK